jgi:hypothetical protein
MTRELKFTSESFGIGKAEDDCYLDPNDPVHEFIISGNASNLNQPMKQSVTGQAAEHQRKLEIAKAQGIKPGSPAWFML